MNKQEAKSSLIYTNNQIESIRSNKTLLIYDKELAIKELQRLKKKGVQFEKIILGRSFKKKSDLHSSYYYNYRAAIAKDLTGDYSFVKDIQSLLELPNKILSLIKSKKTANKPPKNHK